MLKRYEDGAYTDVDTNKRYDKDSAAWVECEFLKRYDEDSAAWVDVWTGQPKLSFVKYSENGNGTYSPSGSGCGLSAYTGNYQQSQIIILALNSEPIATVGGSVTINLSASTYLDTSLASSGTAMLYVMGVASNGAIVTSSSLNLAANVGTGTGELNTSFTLDANTQDIYGIEIELRVIAPSAIDYRSADVYINQFDVTGIDEYKVEFI